MSPTNPEGGPDPMDEGQDKISIVSSDRPQLLVDLEGPYSSRP